MVNNREWDSQDEIGKKKKKTCEMYCSSTRDCLDGKKETIKGYNFSLVKKKKTKQNKLSNLTRQYIR